MKTIQELKGHMNNFMYQPDDKVTMKKEDVETILNYMKILAYKLERSEKAHARAIGEGLRILANQDPLTRMLDEYA